MGRHGVEAVRDAEQFIVNAALADSDFTMALFISGLAVAGIHFEREPQLLILIGFLLATAVGVVILVKAKATAETASTEVIYAMTVGRKLKLDRRLSHNLNSSAFK